MAELGPGRIAGDIAESFDAPVSFLGSMRSSHISKGMIWIPNHGDTAFTVPMFDEFMKRAMPGEDCGSGMLCAGQETTWNMRDSCARQPPAIS